MSHELSALSAIAYRDLLKFLRDPPRIIGTLVFPIIFVVLLGNSFGSAADFGYDFRTYVFTGVFAQTLFQSAALGIVSLIEDRENDFSQAIFIAPVSRYTVVMGKIIGESLVALAQGLVIIALGAVIGVSLTPERALGMLVAALIICPFGGVFGLITMAGIRSQRAVQQIFPFVFFPQYFLAGVFNPMSGLDPLFRDVISRLAPMRYAVDLVRGWFYQGTPEAALTVLDPPVVNLAVILGLTAAFLVVGTALFVRKEQNR